MRRARYFFALTVAVAVLLAACSGNSDEPPATASPSPGGPDSTRGPAPPLPPVIAEALEDVAEVRGLPAPPDLRASLVSREDLPELLDSLITEHDRELLATTTTLYRLLGHFRDDQDYLTLYQSFGATGVLGLYSPADDELWVVSDRGPDGLEDLSRSERETLAHELVHALQDFNFPLDAIFEQVENDLDRSLALSAVVEGDATIHEEIYSDKYIRVPLAGRLWLVGSLSGFPSDVPLSFIRELLFPYTSGADWVRAVRSFGGSPAIDDYLREPPSSTAAILHPDLVLAGFTPAEVELPRLESALGDGWGWESGGALGEFQLRNYIQLGRSSTSARTAAAGWAGDRYDVYTNGPESVGAFHLRFSSDEEAEEFADIHGRMLDDRSESSATEGSIGIFGMPEGKWAAVAARFGTDVFFTIGSSREVALATLEQITGS